MYLNIPRNCHSEINTEYCCAKTKSVERDVILKLTCFTHSLTQKLMQCEIPPILPTGVETDWSPPCCTTAMTPRSLIFNSIKRMFPSSSDIDNNGYLDKHDFECLAVKNTLIEGRGEFSAEAFGKNQVIMKNLWNEIAELADFNKVKTIASPTEDRGKWEEGIVETIEAIILLRG